MPQTGWIRAGGSPSRRSSSRAAGRRDRAGKGLIVMRLWLPPDGGRGRPLPGWQRYGKKDRQAPVVSGTGDRDEAGFPHAGGRGQGKTWAGKAAGQCCAYGFLAFVRRWPGRQSAKNRLPAQGGKGLSRPCLSSVPCFHRIPGGGCQAGGTGPVTGNTETGLCLFPGASRRRHCLSGWLPQGVLLDAAYIILVLLAKIKKWGKSKKKLASVGRIL